MKLILLVILALLSACNPSKTIIDDEFLPTVEISHSNSLISVSSSSVSSGGSVTIRLDLKDSNSNPYISNLPQVSFQSSGGTSTGNIGTVTNQGNGSYVASFTGLTTGTPTFIKAFVDGVEIQSSLPTITVTSGNYSLLNSTLILSAASLSSGSSITATLTIRDNSNNQLSSGGLTVLFSNSGGTSTGTWSATTDNNNGTYTATFTGVLGGTATTASASIQSSSITSTLPTVTVTGGVATKLIFTTQPSSTGTAGVSLGTQPIVTVQDSNSNTVTTSSDSVTLELFSDATCTTQVSTSPNGANSIFGTATVAASSGVATFSGLAIRKALNTLYFKASSGTLTTHCSSLLNISPGSINSIAFSTQPAPLTNDTDTSFTTQPVVTAYDTYLNIASNNSTASITLVAYSDTCSTPVASGISAISNPLTLSNGVATFTSTKIVKTNVVRMGASDGTRSACSDALTMNAGVPASVAISSGNTPTQTAANGTPLGSPFVVIVRDANQNVINGATVNWATTAGSGSIAASSTTNSSGLASATLTLGVPGTNTVTATVNGTAFTTTFTATGTTSAYTQNWPFDAAPNPALTYSFDNSKIDFTAGVCRLKPSDQVDDDNASSGFGGGTSVGTAWDAAGYSRLSQTASATNTAELDASWAPRYSNIVGYWKFNGSGNIVNGDTLNATVGSSGTHSNVNGSGLRYNPGVLYQGSDYDGVDDYATIPHSASINFGAPSSTFSLAFWVKTTSTFLINKDRPNNNANMPYLLSLGATPYFWRWSQTNSSADSFAGTRKINDGNWHHVVFVLNGTTSHSVYVDGTLDVTNTTVWTHDNSSTEPLTIGRYKNHTFGTTYGSGSVDEFAIWNVSLTAAEIQTLYNRQSAKYSGTLTSRVMDALQTGMSWTNLSWIPTLPFFKELPDYASGSVQNESSTDYSSLVGSTGATGANDLMNGVIGLWHLNEASGTSTAGSVIDDSGQGRNGTPTNITFGVNGRLNTGASFNGSSSGIALANSSIANFTSSNFTISFWLKLNSYTTNSVGQGPIPIYKGSYQSSGYYAQVAANGNLSFLTNQSGSNQSSSTGAGAIPLGVWTHVSFVRSGASVKIYINGIDRTSASGTHVNPGSSGAPLAFGNYNNNQIIMNGDMDEVAIWSRALVANEILQLYRRGANRIKYQVRTCTTPNAGLTDCTDDPTGANWKGPDGTNQTYFSELNNNTLPLVMSGDVKKTLPSMLFSTFTNPVSTSRYFQYRTILESDDTGTGCNYGAGATWCSPELKSVTVDPIHYDTSSPTTISKTGVNFYSISNLVQNGNNTLTAQCPGGTVYNLGIGANYSAATWYYWNGSAWAAAGGTDATANTAATIATNASTFGTQVGTGTVYFKAFLKSSGIQKCEMDSLDLSGQQ